MGKLHDFDGFLNESKKHVQKHIDKVNDLFEESLIKEKWLLDLLGKSELGYGEDYDLDEDSSVGPDGLEYLTWIEFKDVPDEVIEAVDKSYEKFMEPFMEWAKKNGIDMFDIEITTGDDNSMQLTFNVGN